MIAPVLWVIAFAAGAAMIGSLLLTGASGLTVALALIATGTAILALIVDGPPPNDRRPW